MTDQTRLKGPYFSDLGPVRPFAAPN